MPTDQKGEKGDEASITELLRSFVTTDATVFLDAVLTSWVDVVPGFSLKWLDIKPHKRAKKEKKP